MTLPTYAEFEATARAQGFDEVLERVWGPGLELPTHSHTFAVSALVAQGEFWLDCGDQTQHLQAGERFELKPNVPHAERYGPQGAVVFVARRHAVA